MKLQAIKIVKYVFTGIGVPFVVAAIWMYANTKTFLQDALTAQGTVVELVRSRSDDSYTYRPVVEYLTSDGQEVEFTSTAGSNPPSYKVGEQVTVYYQLENPHRAKIDGFFSLWGLPLIFGVLGGVFAAFGLGLFYFEYRKKRKIDHLKRYGIPVSAKYLAVERNTSVRVGGRNPYQIVAQWEDTQTDSIYVFKSENLWFDPTDHIDSDKVSVLIDPKNPKKHYMETGFLPKLKS